MLAKDLVHFGVTDAHTLCQFPRRPMGGRLGLLLLYDPTQFARDLTADRSDPRLLARLLQKPLDAPQIESTDHLAYRPWLNPQSGSDVGSAFAFNSLSINWIRITWRCSRAFPASSLSMVSFSTALMMGRIGVLLTAER